MRRISIGAASFAALAWIAGTASATQQAVLTAVQGDASIQERPLDERASLADDQPLVTGEDAGCSVLLDRSALVELCGETQISFARDAKRGNRIVNVEAGDVRLVVEPREAGERIEIHTPAAIATILGTVVYVSVDPQTGATTISSSESRVNIRERDERECTPRGLPAEPGIPECAEGTTIGDLEQLTVVPGERAQAARKLSRQQIDELGGCMLDFGELALAVDRRTQESRAAGRVLEIDIAAAEPLVFEPGGPTTRRERESDAGTATGSEVAVELESIDDADQEEEIIRDLTPDDIPDPPTEMPDCGGIPGEHCGFR